MKPRIGIRPVIDGRCLGIRESLEAQTMGMANAAKKLIEENCFYADGSPVECVIADSTIGGGAEAAAAEEKFSVLNVVATLSVTPCWCYGSETMDLNPTTIKAVWGFNGTERPGAVYLAAVMAAHAQRGLPAFAIYGRDVCDTDMSGITPDVREKILSFARCAVAVGQMRNKAYVNIGGVAMGIAGSCCDANFMQKYLGLRAEWVDMVEINRRMEKGIYDHAEFEKALAWVKANCPEGDDNNAEKFSAAEKEKQWEFTVKMTLIISDIMYGNPKLREMGYPEEANGRNAALAGFQGQRQWTDYYPNADFCEAILSGSFDWNGKREQKILATENDGLNGVSMLFAKLLTQRSAVFADVRTYWSPEAVKRVTGYTPTLDWIAQDIGLSGDLAQYFSVSWVNGSKVMLNAVDLSQLQDGQMITGQITWTGKLDGQPHSRPAYYRHSANLQGAWYERDESTGSWVPYSYRTLRAGDKGSFQLQVYGSGGPNYGSCFSLADAVLNTDLPAGIQATLQPDGCTLLVEYDLTGADFRQEPYSIQVQVPGVNLSWLQIQVNQAPQPRRPARTIPIPTATAGPSGCAP